VNALWTESRLTSWTKVVDTLERLTGDDWVFRGHERTVWRLRTTLERAFGPVGLIEENDLLLEFVRRAPRFLLSSLDPADYDYAAWLGLLQHYGGPTRLLDVTRSPYVALFFAFEPTGKQDRVLWAIDTEWCISACTRIMAAQENRPYADLMARPVVTQAQMVAALLGNQVREPLFESFKRFAGVFPVDPWKPDVRQSAQQAMFLCAADAGLSFMQNLNRHDRRNGAIRRYTIPGSLREEVLRRLWRMNVNAATLFPDLGGLGRSVLTYRPRQLRLDITDD
jgi:hypothetical protein